MRARWRCSARIERMVDDLSPGPDSPLARLDRLLEREILRLRARYQLSLDEFRGLYVSDEQVDRLARGMTADQDIGRPPFAPAPEALCSGGFAPQWAELAARFALQPLDLDVILLAL